MLPLKHGIYSSTAEWYVSIAPGHHAFHLCWEVYILLWDQRLSLGTTSQLWGAEVMYVTNTLLHKKAWHLCDCARQLLCLAETVAEEVCQGGAAADASDAHAAASSSDHESGTSLCKKWIRLDEPPSCMYASTSPSISRLCALPSGLTLQAAVNAFIHNSVITCKPHQTAASGKNKTFA